jgi:folate-dependent phosphoribosylglycinamide formyltransferase PurN
MTSDEVAVPVYLPRGGQAMRTVVFASGGGGNLAAAIGLAAQHPDLVSVGAVVSDRLGIRAIDIAKDACIPVIARDFEAICGRWTDCRNDPVAAAIYKRQSIAFHDAILNDLIEIERKTGCPFDLAVLSYRRWIHGALLERFRDRMINQHAGDLSVLRNGRRAYIGVDPVTVALAAGQRQTRTSTIVVTEGHDAGEILCQGPWVSYSHLSLTPELARKHELVQKERSDWPSLRFALAAIAEGRLALGFKAAHCDGTRRVYLDGHPLPYGGVSIDEDSA